MGAFCDQHGKGYLFHCEQVLYTNIVILDRVTLSRNDIHNQHMVPDLALRSSHPPTQHAPLLALQVLL